MVDWAGVCGPAEEYGCGDPDMDIHDPTGHCGQGFASAASRFVGKLKQLGERSNSLAPVCPYCGSKSRLTTGTEIYPKRKDLHRKYFYVCAPCDAYVGCHRDTIRPLGRLADALLRAAKSAAHQAFDPKWQHGRMSRTQAYWWLANQLQIPAHECHIGMFGLDMCAKVVALCSDDFEVVK